MQNLTAKTTDSMKNIFRKIRTKKKKNIKNLLTLPIYWTMTKVIYIKISGLSKQVFIHCKLYRDKKI